MARQAPATGFTYQDSQAGTLTLAGSLTGEGPVLFTPAHGRRLPLTRGIRDRSAMRRYTFTAGAAPPVTFTDAQSGALTFGGSSSEAKRYTDTRSGTLILSGSVTGEGPVLFTPPHGRRLPLTRGIRDRKAMRRYTHVGRVAVPVVFTDARSGTLVFRGSLSEHYAPLVGTPTVTIGTFFKVGT